MGRDGADALYPSAGADRTYGGGDDFLNPDRGSEEPDRQPDFYSGGSGADMPVASHDGVDVVRCNSGHDEAWVDAADDLRGASCEELHHAGFS